MERLTCRQTVLKQLGATSSEIEELLAYNENVFKKIPIHVLSTLPLEDEPFVETWKKYVTEATSRNVFSVLQEKLVQLQFPIRTGMSETENYQLATRKGVPTTTMLEATGLQLKKMNELSLTIYETAAGKIPILFVKERDDFVRLLQALTKKNEPTPIPNEIGAVMIRGYNNWDRILQYKRAWKNEYPFGDWGKEFQRFVQDKTRYQDSFIVLSSGPYSGVKARDVQLSESEWLARSLIIRRDHEVTHYVTARLLGSMRNNALDELIADYIGIVSANGYYSSDLFLRFMGLENFPSCRNDGRIHSYRASLSDGAFQLLQKLLIHAAINLENTNQYVQERPFKMKEKVKMIYVLTQFTLEQLASKEGKRKLIQTCEKIFV